MKSYIPWARSADDLLALVPPDLRSPLRSAVQRVFRARVAESIPASVLPASEARPPYHVDLLPLTDNELLQMICFVNEGSHTGMAQAGGSLAGGSLAGGSLPPAFNAAMLERELRAVRAELQSAVQAFEMTSTKNRSLSEDAQRAYEESHIIIEELMTAKSGLENSAKEMAILNGRLQDDLEGLRNTSGMLGNILDNMGAAILLLGRDLKIRFFTPAIHSFFRVIDSDIGRPLSDLNYLAPDRQLIGDCEDVLRMPQPLDREIALSSDRWFLRRILPYRTEHGEVDGLVISFSDITETRAMLGAEADANTEQTRHLLGGGNKLRPLLQAVFRLMGSLDAEGSEAAEKEFIREIETAAGALSFAPGGAPEGGQRHDGDIAESRIPANSEAKARIAKLTPREREIMKMVVGGSPSKAIATALRISQRTVENHRAAIMRKTQSRSLPALARLGFASGLSDIREPAEPKHPD
jgi:two-component system CheB/CheR fusion protein